MTHEVQAAALTRGHAASSDDLVTAIDHLARVVGALVGRELGQGGEIADAVGYVHRKLSAVHSALAPRPGAGVPVTERSPAAPL